MANAIGTTNTGCCSSISNHIYSAANWTRNTVGSVGGFFYDCGAKVAEVVRPYFAAVREFASANQQPILIAAVVVAAAAIGGAFYYGLFTRGTGTEAAPAPEATTAPAAEGAPAAAEGAAPAAAATTTAAAQPAARGWFSWITG
ncbi:MAG: hypothetical protein JSS61_00255 [Verrucomicrobia bacterium]|nr:hypothetical protein [Verrucomicrobiota bacterium]